MRVLVFGLNGCVGTALAAVGPALGAEIIGPTRFEIDVTDHAAVAACIRAARPDAVIDCVAIPTIVTCEHEAPRALALHAAAPLAMIDACNEIGAAFVYTSTHAVFDGTKETPWLESDPPSPLNVYGATKVAGEMLTNARAQAGYVVRYPTLFGPRRNAALGFVDKMAERLRAHQPVRVARDRMDSPSYSLDVAAATLRLVLERRPPGLYHLGNAGMVDYHSFILALRDLLAKADPVIAGIDVAAGLDADFPSPVRKPLRTALGTLKGETLRPWRDALEAWVREMS